MGSARRNRSFLFSVLVDQLPRRGYSLTLTVRKCPPTEAEWARLRKNFFQRVRSMGMICGHWVTEWQSRGVPHLHAVFFMPDDCGPVSGILVDHWLEVSAEYLPRWQSQHIAPLTSRIGWLKYLAKHGIRGIGHYQRNSRNIPIGWRKKTGAMWGILNKANWPLGDPEKFGLDLLALYRLRRVLRGISIGMARRTGKRKDILKAKHTLRDNDEARSRCKRFSTWLPDDISRMALLSVAMRGSSFSSRGQGGLIIRDDEVILSPTRGFQDPGDLRATPVTA